MSAVFGFTGPPRPNWLAHMRDSLAHRGRASYQSHVTRHGCVGYLSGWSSPGTEDCFSGLTVDANRVVAVAGFLNRSSRTANSPWEELADWRGTPRSDARLRGDFAIALLDGRAVHLIRDGAGNRTIYFSEFEGRFLFASEPKALWQLPGFPRRLRAASLAQYLTFSFVPGEHTMLEGVFEVPAGHGVTRAQDGQWSRHRHFVFEAEPDPSAAEGSEDVWVERFRKTFSQAVRERMPAREPVAVFLSGGLDSSVVTAEVARQSPQPVRTFALHFGRHYPHELNYAAAVARRCRTQHEEILIRPRDFLPRLRRMVWHLDDPIGDPITMPNFELAARVAEHTRWVFNGEGGDPCFGGPKNIPMLLSHWYGGVPRDPMFREKAYLASYRRGYEEVSRLLTPQFRRDIDENRDLEQVLTPFFACRHPRNFLDKLAAINIRLKGAHLILPKVERMLGAAGIVPLAPLFADEIVRLSFAIPTRLKLRGGVEKIILKRAYADELPTEVLSRPKSGMRVPVHFWFRGELKRFARKILSPREIRRVGIFDPTRVKQLLDYQTEEGPGRYGLRLWMLLTFEIWRRIVIEGEAV